MRKQRFTFSVLRYVHDVLTGEFVNIGVLVFFPASSGAPASLRFAAQRTIGRMRKMFPDLDRTEFLSALSALERSARRLSSSVEQDGLGLQSDKDALFFGRQLLVEDDSAMRWSPVGGGVTADREKTFERLYLRYVGKYDRRNFSRRSDEEVWRPVRQMLDERELQVPLEEKVISGDGDQVLFQHAWKNGVWHVYEPVSFDLADADGIAKKAHRWLGQMTSIGHQPTEAFHAHFFVGAPDDETLLPAYKKAIRILQKSPGRVDVYEENDLGQFVDRIEDEYRAHLGA